MADKKIPQRRCLGCSGSKDKKELIRIVRLPDGSVTVDPTGKKNGRGAYLCASVECLKKIKKTKRLERGLSIRISDDIYDIVENFILNKNPMI